MRRALFLIVVLLCIVIGAKADGVYFNYNPDDYHQRTVIHVSLVDNSGAPVRGYLGAFIDGECRYEAQLTTINGQEMYQLVVGGDATTEMNKTITLKFFKVSAEATSFSGSEYLLENTFTFLGDYTVNDPSAATQITFIPVTNVVWTDPVRVARGTTVDLTDFIASKTPENGTLPVLTWEPGSSDYFTISGNNLTAVQATTGRGETLQAMSGEGQLGNSFQVDIYVKLESAAWKEEYASGVTIPVGDARQLISILSNGYTLTPTDANTSFTWTSSNEDVIALSPEGGWDVKAKGTTTITGTATDGSGVQLPPLTVTVIQPVTAITLKNRFLLAEIGEDFTTRLNAMAEAYPADANNKTLNWTLLNDATGAPVTSAEQDTYGHFVAKAFNGELVRFTVTAADGFGATENFIVCVLPKQPTALSAIQQTLSLMKPADSNPDVTANITGNVTMTPADLDQNDNRRTVSAMFTNLKNELSANNDESLQNALNNLDYIESAINNTLTFAFKGHEEILQINDGPVYTLIGSGSFTATASIVRAKLNAFDDASTFQAGAVPDATKLQEELTAEFTIQVGDGLAGFYVPATTMAKGETIRIKLTEQPQGCEFDKTLISLRIEPDMTTTAFPRGWTYATVTPANDDATGLSFDIDAQSIGKGTIYVDYGDKSSISSGTIDVQQQLNVSGGWQWVALTQDGISSVDSLKTVFGLQDLKEIRSQTQLLINDAQWGYVGELTRMDAGQTYKVCMKDGVKKSFGLANVNSYLQNLMKATTVSTVKGWNWVGNPYQYYQPISDIFAGVVFSEGDIIKSKNAAAHYSGGQWTGELTHIAPGEGILIWTANAGTVTFAPEGGLAQNTNDPSTARGLTSDEPTPWTVDGSPFDDNMAMVAQIYGVNDPSRVTLWAFVGNECRGRGVAIDGRQFITVHGNVGEKVTFVLYDALTRHFHEIYGSRTLASSLGTVAAPVALHAGKAVTAIENITTSQKDNGRFYDLQGRPVKDGSMTKGIYVSNGRKMVVK